ncbi:sulfite exporter TauE/SafE family protein [Ligilactobacillus aviarius]|uniref:sulfite exporter TauE/SafE family protein n=1 Tax=Ligilactobacillus aviarius TaxID=1606 RepID=UPI00249EA601|nr:sulfite exporter TauE/SafE family protein [Ligilactobacillus aviarius]
MVKIIIGILILCILYLALVIIRQVKRNHEQFNLKDNLLGMGIAGIADFGDTLGIGSFITTTTMFQMTHYLKDERDLPGTLNIAHGIPTIIEALFFVTAVPVQPLTLTSMVLAAVIGATIGSFLVVKMSSVIVQRFMAVALVITSLLMVANKMGWINILAVGNNADGLHGWALVIGVIGNFILGGLMAAGVGLYAPCMVMIYLLGLKPIAAFPIMMLSCALLMPFTSFSFVKSNRFSTRGIFGFVIGGVIGVIIAATLVKSMSFTVLSWLIVIVSILTAISLWSSSIRAKKESNYDQEKVE